MVAWAALGKAAMGGLKGGAKKVATNKLLNKKKQRPKKRTSGKEVSEGIIKNEKGEGKKGGSLAVRPRMGLVATAKDFDSVSTTAGESDIVIIRKQVIQVRDILKDTHSAKQAERASQKKAGQGEKRKDREDKIEKSKVKPTQPKTGIKMPKMGANIGNFFAWLAFGVILNKLWQFLPELIKVGKIVGPIAKFIGGVIEKTFGLVVGSIELAYAGVDKLKELIVGIGGEGAGKLFDKFGRLFTQVMNGALIAASIGALIGGGRRFRGKGPKGPKGPKPKWQKKLQQKWKGSRVGKFIRNQKAGLTKFTRKISRGPIGKTFKALRPKNISKWIKSGGVDKALKGGVKNIRNFARSPVKNIQKLTRKIKPAKTLQKVTKNIQNITKKIKPGKTIQKVTKNITQNLKKIKPGKTIQNLTKKIKPVKTFQNLTRNIKPVKTFQNLTRNIKPGQTIQNLTKNIKPGQAIQNVTKNIQNIKPGQALQRINPFKGMNLGKKAGNLLKSAKQMGSKALAGLDNWAKNQMGKLGTMWKGAKAWGAQQAAKLGNIAKLAKNPRKLMEVMKGKLMQSIDDIVKKNKTLKNLLKLAKNPKKISGAIKGMLNTAGKSKGMLNFQKALSRAKAAKVGGVDKLIAAVMALINYTTGGESPINAIVKAVSGMLGYAAGFAIGAPFGGMPGFITGMAGGALGELAGFGLLKVMATTLPKLTQIVDPIMGAGPDGDGRPLLRDPSGPVDHMMGSSKEEGKKAETSPKTSQTNKEVKVGKKTLDLSKPMGGLSRDEWTNDLTSSERNMINRRMRHYADKNIGDTIKSNRTVSPAEGLDTKPSYGSGGFVPVENTTTYIQPIEV